MRAKHSQEFKVEAVALVLSSNLPPNHVSHDLAANYQTLSNWMRAALFQA